MADEQGAPRNDLLIWIDLEMTGLDPNRERIIEIATLITDSELNLIAEGPALAVHQPDALLNGMDDWNQKTHGASGLIERVKQSPVDTAAAERQTLEFLAAHVVPGAVRRCVATACIRTGVFWSARCPSCWPSSTIAISIPRP